MILISKDLKRVLGLPHRDPPAPDAWSLPPSDGSSCACTTMGRKCLSRLFGAQRAALEEMRVSRGLFGMISVGNGKTSLGLLAAIAMNRTPAVLFLPPGQVGQTVEEAAWVGQHLRIPKLYVVESGARSPRRQNDTPGTSQNHELYLVPYSTLSRPEASALLERICPTLIIADEAHKLRHPGTATTKRVLRYLADHEDCAFVCWSGTLTSRSLRDYSHLAAFALREGSPLPLELPVIDQWADCFDAGQDAVAKVGAFAEYLLPGEDPREGFRRRLFRTAGVVGSVASAAEDLPALTYEVIPIVASPEAQEALQKLENLWALPNGEELTLATEMWRAKTEMLCNFHYLWVWPPSVTVEVQNAWIEARGEWHRELRGRLARASRINFDSPALVERAMLAGEVPSSEAFERWNLLRRDIAPPDTVPEWLGPLVWIDDVIDLAIARRAIVWFTHDAIGVALSSRLPVYAEAHGLVATLREAGGPPVALSIKACGQGVDGLQRLYHEQIICCPFSSGEGWEQLLGRLHRKGQEQVLRTAILRRDLEFVVEARERARYVRQTMGLEQKLLLGTGLEDIERMAEEDQVRMKMRKRSA